MLSVMDFMSTSSDPPAGLVLFQGGANPCMIVQQPVIPRSDGKSLIQFFPP